MNPIVSMLDARKTEEPMSWIPRFFE